MTISATSFCVISLVCGASASSSGCHGYCRDKEPDGADANALLQQRVLVSPQVGVDNASFESLDVALSESSVTTNLDESEIIAKSTHVLAENTDTLNAGTCKEPVANRADAGWWDGYRGWFDVQGCGKCNDYCRWVGGSGSGGDPTKKRIHSNSFWSCRLAGTTQTHSPKGYFSSWNFVRCQGQGASPPEPCKPSPNRDGAGYSDGYRGWYDVQGCGTCNDYCRWVGCSGSGGDPTEKLIHKHGANCESWWSCRLAGTAQKHSPKGYFSSWKFMKCSGEGSAAPPQIPPATPYIPGETGSAWTAAEMLIVRAKLHRMFNEGGALLHERGVYVPPPWLAAVPSAAKVLRLGFHDCLKYTDGTGGCDGCLEWDGVEHRYPLDQLCRGVINASSRPDGHNNGLSPTVQILEAIYTDRAFPMKTPMLPLSLQQSGKSRADLWAFAVVEAVRYSVDLNNMACADSEGLLKLGINQCHPRVNTDDCSISVPTLIFKTGRKDCISTKSPSFIASKSESHPNPQWNGSQVVDFLQRDFGFNGRETVAIMGAHTLGSLHASISLMRYTWKARSAELFNNGYYRNMVKKADWYYDSGFTNKRKPCADSTLANSSGQPPEARWVTHVRGDTTVGGPVQWIQEKFVCPKCGNKKRKVNSGDACCSGVPKMGLCNPGCESWRFVSGLDETMLSSDMGLYRQFNVDSNGIPYGCDGFQKFNLESWKPWNPSPRQGFANYHYTWPIVNGKKAEPLCALNDMSVPPGSTPLYQVVEEYADDQAKFISDFFPALEKMLSNGYSDTELQTAPSGGMSGFSCPFQEKTNQARSYVCTVN